MELHHLRYFVAVGEVEHFRRAAERLNVAQSALSRQIVALEQELGVPLFIRLPRGIRLTEAGRTFLLESRRILSDIERACDHARRAARGQIGTLRVSFPESGLWRGIIPSTIHAFRSMQPDVELNLQPLGTLAQVDGIRKGTIDVAFVYEQLDNDPVVATAAVQNDRIIIAAPASHHLASRSAVRLRDLIGEPLIWIARAPNPPAYDALMAACRKGGLEPQIVLEAATTVVALGLVAVGMGIGLVPAAMRWRFLDGIVMIPIQDLNVPYRLDIAWRRDDPSSILHSFVQLAQNFARTGYAEGDEGQIIAGV